MKFIHTDLSIDQYQTTVWRLSVNLCLCKFHRKRRGKLRHCCSTYILTTTSYISRDSHQEIWPQRQFQLWLTKWQIVVNKLRSSWKPRRRHFGCQLRYQFQRIVEIEKRMRLGNWVLFFFSPRTRKTLETHNCVFKSTLIFCFIFLFLNKP